MIKLQLALQFSGRSIRFNIPGHPGARLREPEHVDAGGDLLDEKQEDLVRHVQDVTR